MPSSFLLYALIALSVFLLVEGLYLTIFGKTIRLDRKVNRRLAMLERGTSRAEVKDLLRKEMTQHFRLRAIPLYGAFARKAQRANIAFSPLALVGVMVLMSALAFLALLVGTQAAPGLRLALSVIIGVGSVYFWVHQKAQKRVAIMEEQLPEAVELMVRSLRVGHPFASALGVVAKEIPDPLGSEFGLIADEAAYGRDMAEALQALAERIDLQDLRFLAVAVSIQQQSGGNLAEILEGLSRVIRARFKLFRRVRAITAEAKWSGMFLSAFPIVAMVMIQLIKPDYYDEVKETALFLPAALGVCAFLVVNIIYMKMMVNIKV